MSALLRLLPLFLFIVACVDTKTENELRTLKEENIALRAQLDSLMNGPSQSYAQAVDDYNSNQLERSLNTLESLRQRFPQWQHEQVSSKISEISTELRKRAEEKQRSEAALNKYITKSFDSFQKITWYETTRNTTNQTSAYQTFTVELYLGVTEAGTKLFRLRSKYFDENGQYHDTKWIFYDAVHLLGDDGTRLVVKTDYPQKQSDNGSYGLKEWSDNLVDDQIVLKLANSRKIEVRFQGKYTHDFQMTPNQLHAFKEIVEKSKRL